MKINWKNMERELLRGLLIITIAASATITSCGQKDNQTNETGTDTEMNNGDAATSTGDNSGTTTGGTSIEQTADTVGMGIETSSDAKKVVSTDSTGKEKTETPK